MTNSTTDAAEREDTDDEAVEHRMFLDGTLNGDEKMNRFAKLVDSRFGSQARRTNKLRAEVHKDLNALRDDLEPALRIARAVGLLFDVWDTVAPAARVIGAVGGFVVGALLFAVGAGLIRMPF